MHNYEELLAKSKEWREWYYDGAPTPNPVTESVSMAELIAKLREQGIRD